MNYTGVKLGRATFMMRQWGRCNCSSVIEIPKAGKGDGVFAMVGTCVVRMAPDTPSLPLSHFFILSMHRRKAAEGERTTPFKRNSENDVAGSIVQGQNTKRNQNRSGRGSKRPLSLFE